MTLQDRNAGRTFSVRGASAREPPKVADNEPLGRCLKLGDDPVLGVNERRPGETGVFHVDEGQADSRGVRLATYVSLVGRRLCVAGFGLRPAVGVWHT